MDIHIFFLFFKLKQNENEIVQLLTIKKINENILRSEKTCFNNDNINIK